MPASVHSDAYSSAVEHLIQLRKERGLLQSDVAKRLGKHQQFVSKVENRVRRLDIVEFCVYARALGADPVELLRTIVRDVPGDTRI